MKKGLIRKEYLFHKKKTDEKKVTYEFYNILINFTIPTYKRGS